MAYGLAQAGLLAFPFQSLTGGSRHDRPPESMPPLTNPRHERFAQELAKGETADAAYENAGFSANRGNATRLKAIESVQKRVAELQERGAKKAEVTVESIVNELEEARVLGAELGQPAAMVSASFNKARLLGLVIEKREDVTPRRTPEQIRARIRELAASGGAGGNPVAPRGAGAAGAGDEALPTVPGHGTA